MTVVGTIKTNPKGVGDLKKMDGSESQTTEDYWEKEKGAMAMTSYVINTKSSGKRNVLVLATANPILGVTKDDRKSRPAIIKFYDYTKGGTDIMDQKMGKYLVKPKSSKWTVCAFSYILDITQINAATLSRLNDKHTAISSFSLPGVWLSNWFCHTFVSSMNPGIICKTASRNQFLSSWESRLSNRWYVLANEKDAAPELME